jgi:hypothetical protein
VIELSAYVVGPDGVKTRHLAGPEKHAPTERPIHTTVETPCFCPIHRSGQVLYPAHGRDVFPAVPAVVSRTADDLGGQGRSGGLS